MPFKGVHSSKYQGPSKRYIRLLGLFKKKGYSHNVKGIQVDSGAPCKHTGVTSNGMARIKVKFKADDKPEALSRLIDEYISLMQDPNQGKDLPENIHK